ncbi:hypothetical protein CYQ88_04210 [Hydrogenovibrio sp. SC-1]|uniref:FIST signal transduction protein n=1 Tax=Hydrogenovibrio sp. SC-1 TaxID=2065820 RepID=UPI000C7B9FAB|nr:FIST N-terminal domain-containing protein [Hydrogenovibrio sp. SC-1]PLA74800.1 hypothetical protein CYQ88_04210 [Hydrogenovibrio sp. SC-1]
MKISTFEYLDQQWSHDLTTLTAMNTPNTLGLVFADNQLDGIPDILKTLFRSFPDVTFVGGSSAGEVLGSEVKDGSVVVALLQLEKTRFEVAITNVDDYADSYALGTSLSMQLTDKSSEEFPLKGVFVLSDGLNVNGTQLSKGLVEQAPNVLITGGLMGDGPRFETTHVLANHKWRSGQVIAIGFYGDAFQMGYGSQGGWDVFGPERLVTKSVENEVFEFDGTPALDLYKTYLGDLAEGLPSTALLYPLSLVGDDGAFLVRTIVQIDEDKKSLIFAGDVPEGARVQLMKANFDRLIDGAFSAAESVGWSESDEPVLSIAISCVGRRLILKGRVEEEVEVVLEALPDNTQQIGFYSYGELSPLSNGRCSLHNQTMTLTTFREV